MILPQPVTASVEYLRRLVNSITTGWNVEHTAEGRHDWQWVDLPYASTSFTTDDGTAWTVDGADAAHYRIGRQGDLRLLTFRIINTDVASTPNELRVALPAGYTVNGEWAGALRYSDAGTAGAGAVRAVDGDRFVRCVKNTGTWTTTSSDNTTVIGTVWMRVSQD